MIFFFFNDPATTEIYPLSLHDALPIWANEAWGSYWSWDPKETWALITWLVFAAYLHARITRGWQGRRPAILAASGFMVVWICYLGVNLLGKGLHSYGWFF